MTTCRTLLALLFLLGIGSGCTAPDVCLTPEFGCEGIGGTTGPVSFESDVVPLLGNTCGLNACHQDPGQDQFETDLVARDCQGFFAELGEERVNEPDTGPRLDVVNDPASPANTFFILKGDGDLLHIADYLPNGQYNILVAWVGQGAANDCP